MTSRAQRYTKCLTQQSYQLRVAVCRRSSFVDFLLALDVIHAAAAAKHGVMPESLQYFSNYLLLAKRLLQFCCTDKHERQ